jgi:hypothetical protein
MVIDPEPLGLARAWLEIDHDSNYCFIASYSEGNLLVNLVVLVVPAVCTWDHHLGVTTGCNEAIISSRDVHSTGIQKQIMDSRNSYWC